jgi:sec-independent protein translocase protein TatA
MMDLLPMQFGLPGGPEVLIILLIAVLLFGANKIPKLARSTGEAMGEFQKGRQEVEEELKDMRDGATGQRPKATRRPTPRKMKTTTRTSKSRRRNRTTGPRRTDEPLGQQSFSASRTHFRQGVWPSGLRREVPNF